MTLHTSVAATRFLYGFVLAACGGEAAAGGGPGGGPPVAHAADGRRSRHAHAEAGRTHQRIHRDREIAALDDDSAAGRRLHHEHQRAPGQRVARGAVLMQIDSGRQQATVASLESVRAAREADLQFARQQAERMKKLFDAGAVSQQEYEQAATAVQTTRSAAARRRRADSRAARRARLSPRDRTDGGHRRRHPGACRRPRDARDDADDGRRKRGPRAVHQRARCAGSRPEAGPGRADRRRRRQRSGDDERQLHLPVGRSETQSVLVKAPLATDMAFRHRSVRARAPGVGATSRA